MGSKKMKGWIGLEKLSFHANHGVYEEERNNGNTFLLDVFVKGDLLPAATSDSIEKAFNYELIASVCQLEMNTPSKTLENIAYRIIKSLFDALPVDKIKLKLSKTNPPIDEECESSFVKLSVSRKHLD